MGIYASQLDVASFYNSSNQEGDGRKANAANKRSNSTHRLKTFPRRKGHICTRTWTMCRWSGCYIKSLSLSPLEQPRRSCLTGVPGVPRNKRVLASIQSK